MGLLDRLKSKKGKGEEPEVAVIGIDGVPFDLLRRGMDEGWMENLAALGSADRMRATIPVVSSVCWPSATTGLNPGGTGVYGFQERKEGSSETYVPLSRNVHGDRIWDRAGEAGKRSLVMNVPVTFPPQSPPNGTLVSGFLSPDVDRACTSPEVAERLKKMDYRVDADVSLHDDLDRFMEDIHATLDARLEAFETMAREESWSLFFGVVMETDRLNHFYWSDYADEGKYLDDFLDVYRKIDRFIGDFRDQLPEDAELIVMSDHGFTELEKEIDLNAWLAERGYLERGGDLAGSSGTAYSMTPGRVYLDTESNRPGGSLPDEEYDATRKELAEALRGVQDPETGEAVVDEVYLKEELYTGPHAGTGPDIVVQPVDGYDLKGSFDEKPLARTGPRTGMHTLEDASLLSTADLDSGASVWDVGPTVLDLLDLRHDDLDGDSLLT